LLQIETSEVTTEIMPYNVQVIPGTR